MSFSINNTKRKRPFWRWFVIGGISIIVITALAFGGAYVWQQQNLRPKSSQSTTIRVSIPLGSSIQQIGQILQSEGVIRNALAFVTYAKSKEYEDSFKAGTYELDPSKSVQDIVALLIEGNEASDLVTFPPGLRLDQVKQRLIKAGFTSAEVDAGLNPSLYKDHPALVSKPRDASLEGYLYPESYQVTENTTVGQIVEQALDETAQRLTPERIQAFASHGLSPHQAVILASIVEKEVPLPEDRRMVAQVFLTRLAMGMQLGSDVTYEYAAAITGETAHPDLDSPYNTRKYEGLPPGPISNVDETALDAVAYPTATDYVYFLSGDDDKTYFAHTFEEHEENIREHCQRKCQ